MRIQFVSLCLIFGASFARAQEKTPPAPPDEPPAPPASIDDREVQSVPPEQPPSTGQWVYTTQYGWIWMPYGAQYTYEPTNGAAYANGEGAYQGAEVAYQSSEGTYAYSAVEYGYTTAEYA